MAQTMVTKNNDYTLVLRSVVICRQTEVDDAQLACLLVKEEDNLRILVFALPPSS